MSLQYTIRNPDEMSFRNLVFMYEKELRLIQQGYPRRQFFNSNFSAILAKKGVFENKKNKLSEKTIRILGELENNGDEIK